MKRKIKAILIGFTLLLAVLPGVMSGFEQDTKTALYFHNSNDEYDMIVITPETFSDELQSLKDHKEQHGIRTQIISLDDIYNSTYFPVSGRDNPEKIKYFIKYANENWNVQYVMLVGGKNEMPVRYSNIYFNSYCKNIKNQILFDFYPIKLGAGQFITDLYYADIFDKNGSFCSWDSNNNDIFAEMNSTTIIDDVDLYPDVCIGRLLCSTRSEMLNVIQKIISYENNAFDTSWFTNLILFGGDEHANIFIENLLPIGFNTFGRTAWEGEYICNTVASYLNGFTAKKYYASGLFKPCAEPLTIQNINGAINNGAGFMLFAGHGSPSMIATHPPFTKQVWVPSPSGYTSSEVQNLSNKEKLPIAVLCACSTGDFDTSSSPLAWELVKHNNGGAIACFAATTEANVMPSTLCTKTLFGHLTVGVFKSYAENIDIIGEIWRITIENYLNDEEALLLGNPHLKIGPFTIESDVVWGNHLNVEQWELFGDPSLKIGGYE